MTKQSQPNIIFVFADQWRAQATGYNGDPNVRTPHLDGFVQESINFTTAVSNCPVCSPWRATLMTGQYPLTHGVFVNDVPISSDPVYLAECFQSAGYRTAYIGKWHIDGHGRGAYIPPERRKGFAYWKVRECTHDYNNSFYYADSPDKLWWEGYDAIAQTEDAVKYIQQQDQQSPFLLMLSWGPPHDPYNTAPDEYRSLYSPQDMKLRPNVPVEIADEVCEGLAGYYAHCSALDWCFGQLLKALDETGLADDTVVVFTSDHGDMLGSHGARNKQRPWDESILVPMLLRYPRLFGRRSITEQQPFNTIHLMPTLLGLAGLPIPGTVEGADFTPYLCGDGLAPESEALIELPACFHQYAYYRGGKEWRGLRSSRYTYVINLDGPWYLFDNERDPYQMDNVVGQSEYAEVEAYLDAALRNRLTARGDAFLPGPQLIEQAGYAVDARGDPIYTQ
ncbi:MAG: sulfatase [Anaerolineae bacterium]|nr:sulfatase [Anaerolineae bacterium]